MIPKNARQRPRTKFLKDVDGLGVKLTSPYGGPCQVAWERMTRNRVQKRV